jgi:uncharacterized repeat protein (TIGR03803 family)
VIALPRNPRRPSTPLSGLCRLLWLTCLAAGVVSHLRAQSGAETVLYNFNQPARGSGPSAELIRDAAGNFYGTTANGGQAGWGTVYKVESSGKQTVLYAFSGGADGATPYGSLAHDAAGNLYGTTYLGGLGFGDAGYGVVFKLSPAGQQTVLFTFGAIFDDGLSPYSGVVLDSAGNIYGTTSEGGQHRGGVAFKIDPSGNFTVLHAFGASGDGFGSDSPLLLDAAGNLYGTTYGGGAHHEGTVFQLDPSGNETLLYSFTGGSDGASPFTGSLTRDPSGTIFGATFYGGAAVNGVIFKLDSTGHETVLHNFTGGADGGQPYGGVVLDEAGNLYGTASDGGVTTGVCNHAFEPGCGVVFKLDPSGQETVLYAFTGGSDGNDPVSGLLLDAAGNVYGTTFFGGSANLGAVYSVSATGQQRTLFSFPGAVGGNLPLSGVILDQAGNIYGAARDGGRLNQGVVYKLGASGNLTTLYSFTGGADGANPHSSLIRDSAGNLYGTASGGGASGNGVVYEVDTSGAETVLHSFGGGADGSDPVGGVTRGPSGSLYGTTASGGVSNLGVLYSLDVAGNETILHTFTGGDDGSTPYAAVTFDSAGNLYGTASGGGAYGGGVVYKLDASGSFTILYAFTGGADGLGPWGGVVLDASGNLYGTTPAGGTNGRGVVFKLDPAGNETVLHNFGGSGDGEDPQAGVILDPEGNLYGTAYDGGSSNFGVVFEVTPAGQESILYNFADKADGGFPAAGVVRDSSGKLYGTASSGGEWTAGTIYKVTP